jgi:hypothetical protein
VLLAWRPLDANSDAKHPGKAEEQSTRESSLFPWDFPGFLRPEAFKILQSQVKAVFINLIQVKRHRQ